MAFEEGAGVAEVLFGVGRGAGDAFKRLVEDADDAMLFGERRDGNLLRADISVCHCWIARTPLKLLDRGHETFGLEKVEHEAVVHIRLSPEDEVTRAAHLVIEFLGNDGDAPQSRADRSEQNVVGLHEPPRSTRRIFAVQSLRFFYRQRLIRDT